MRREDDERAVPIDGGDKTCLTQTAARRNNELTVFLNRSATSKRCVSCTSAKAWRRSTAHSVPGVSGVQHILGYPKPVLAYDLASAQRNAVHEAPVHLGDAAHLAPEVRQHSNTEPAGLLGWARQPVDELSCETFSA